MSLLAVVQARMTSRRLPGKVLLPLSGQPVLDHVVRRVLRARNVKDLVVATSLDESDDPINFWCQDNRVKCFRGSLNDVLDRFVKAARYYCATSVLRITADCPVVDPDIIDEVIQNFYLGSYDLYGLSGEFPDGLDCTVYSLSSLEAAWSEASLRSDREHVGPFIERNDHRFNVGGLDKFKNCGFGKHRWTLDTPEDYTFLQCLFDELKHAGYFGYKDIVDAISSNPSLTKINSHIRRNEGYIRSLAED